MVDHWSHSQVETCLMCMEAWRRRYLEGDKIPPGIAMVSGSSFHTAPEWYYKAVMAGNDPLTVDDCRDLVATEFLNRISEEGIYLTRDEVQKKNILLTEGRDNVIRAAAKFRLDVAETFLPTLVEHDFLVEMPGIVKPFKGRIDLFTEDRHLPDWKLSKSFTSDKAHRSHQPTIYGQAIKQINGEVPSKNSFQVFKPLKKEVKHIEFATTRDQSDCKALASVVQIVQGMIDAGNYPPPPPGHWRCTDTYCGYFGSCKLVSDRLKRLPNV